MNDHIKLSARMDEYGNIHIEDQDGRLLPFIKVNLEADAGEPTKATIEVFLHDNVGRKFTNGRGGRL